MRFFTSCLIVLLVSCLVPLFTAVPSESWGYWSSEPLLPTVANVGPVLDANQDANVAYIYHVLQSEFSVEWLENWVERDLRKSFNATFGAFLANELPFTALLVTQPQRETYLIQATGSSGRLHTFDLVLATESEKTDRIQALANLASEALIFNP